MSELVKKQESNIVVSDSSAIMSVIERAASDPNVDIDKMERLMAMHERMIDKQSEMAFTEAMTASQTAMRPISADATNPQTHSQYASYAKLDKALRPIYTEHGFSLSFDTTEATRPEFLKVLCIVSHKNGHSRSFSVDMPADGKGAKGGDVMTKTHATGAAMTYGMRYLLKMIFNVAIGEDDDDGYVPPVEKISEEQELNLIALIDEVKANKNRFLTYFKINSVAGLSVNAYPDAVRMLESMRGKK